MARRIAANDKVAAQPPTCRAMLTFRVPPSPTTPFVTFGFHEGLGAKGHKPRPDIQGIKTAAHVSSRGDNLPQTETRYSGDRDRLTFENCSPDEARWRPGWDELRPELMTVLLRQQCPRPALAQALLATGKAVLGEHDGWGDRFRGVSGDRGENHLGNLRMELRSELGG